MIPLLGSRKIFLRASPTDIRLGFNGLSGIIESEFKSNPTSGNLFVFLNRRKNRMKILVWETGGFWLLCKRLEKGTFPVQFTGELPKELTRFNLTSILDGIEVMKVKQRTRLIISHLD